jgi:RNA polymerase sigma factor (TIGR02999 family)
MDDGTLSGVRELESLIQRATRETEGAEQLFVLLYSELRKLARSLLRRQSGWQTLGATTLVHEAYLRMAKSEQLDFPDRTRFFAYAARAMRGLAVDHMRRRGAAKRGRKVSVPLEGHELACSIALQSSTDLPALGDAIDSLSQVDESLAETVELHFFGGLSFVEIAGLRCVSVRTVQREWHKARLVLHRALQADALPSECH